MPNARLFVMDGMSNVWKKELCHYVRHIKANSTVVIKSTTRKEREPGEFGQIELVHVEPEQFAQFSDYRYEYGSFRYGIRKSDIECHLASHDNVFVIVRNKDVILQIKKDFAAYCPTTAFVYVDSQVVAARQLSPEILRSVESAKDDFLVHPEVYDEVLVDITTNDNDLRRLIELLIRKGAEKKSGVVTLQRLGTGTIVGPKWLKRLAKGLASVALTLAGALFIAMVTGGPVDPSQAIDAANRWRGISLTYSIFVMVAAFLVTLIPKRNWVLPGTQAITPEIDS